MPLLLNLTQMLLRVSMSFWVPSLICWKPWLGFCQRESHPREANCATSGWRNVGIVRRQGGGMWVGGSFNDVFPSTRALLASPILRCQPPHSGWTVESKDPPNSVPRSYIIWSAEVHPKGGGVILEEVIWHRNS